MTNKELSTKIREELKKAGYNVRDCFGIRVKASGYSTCARVTVKNAAVDLDAVRAVLDRFEDIRRDARSGEILCGANTYIFVEPEDGLYTEAAGKYRPDARDAIEKATNPAYNDCCLYSNRGRMLCAYYENGTIHVTAYEDTGSYLKEHGRRRVSPADVTGMAEIIYKLNAFGKIA